MKVSILETLNGYYREFKLNPALFRSPIEPYRKFEQDVIQVTVSSEFRDWYESESINVDYILNVLSDNGVVLGRGLIDTEKNDNSLESQAIIELPFEECLKLCPKSFGFHELIENSSKIEKLIFILGHCYVIPPLCCFILADLSSIHKITLKYPNNFDLIVLDPPWESKSVYRNSVYSFMDHRDLVQIPIKELANPSNCVVAIWVTNRQKFHQFILETLFPRWDVIYVTTWFWLKMTKNGQTVCPLNSAQRKPYEKLIIGKIGNVSKIQQDRVIMACPTQHSQKPPLFGLIGHQNPLEIFARNLTPNCTSIGNQVLKFQDLKYFDRIADDLK
jgi:N6-adenosine-specific RNA methylase IME4